MSDLNRFTESIKKGDKAAFDAMYDATSPALYRFAFSMLGDADESYDVLQEVYCKLWETRSRLTPDKSLKALLFTMVRNTSISLMKKSKSMHLASASALEEASTGQAETPESETISTEIGALVYRWIGEMPERRREIFVLSRIEGLGHQEIADVLGIAPRTVTNHIVNALQFLRKRMAAFDKNGGLAS